MQVAKVAGAAVAFWQDVLQYQSQEGYAIQGAGFHLFGLAVLVTEGDLSVFVREDVFLLYHPPIQIAPKVDQSVLSSANGFAIHHPVGRIVVWQGESCLSDARQQLGTKYFGQGFVVKQVVAVFMTHASLFGIKGDSGHDEMHMGVIVQSAVMGM